ncbi:MAG: mechanosensitive ion channel domain-containing protein, partial [Chloroflexota bacterium]
MSGPYLPIDWASVIAVVLGRGLRIVLIIVLAYVLYSVLKRVMPGMVSAAVVKGEGECAEEELAKRSATLSHFALRIAFFAILTIAMFMVLSDLGIDIAPVLAGAGIAGIAIGFGAQTLVRDLISGFFILMEDQYRVGDVAKVADVT